MEQATQPKKLDFFFKPSNHINLYIHISMGTHWCTHLEKDTHTTDNRQQCESVSEREKNGRDERGIIIKHWTIQGGYLWHESSWHAPCLSLESGRKTEQPAMPAAAHFFISASKLQGKPTAVCVVSYLVKIYHSDPFQWTNQTTFKTTTVTFKNKTGICPSW